MPSITCEPVSLLAYDREAASFRFDMSVELFRRKFVTVSGNEPEGVLEFLPREPATH